MTSERVIQELRTFAVPGAPAARERAMTKARNAHRRWEATDRKRQRSPRRLTIALASIAALLAVSLTPAGHAATGWVTELVGITHIPKNHPPRGHIGGRPTDPTSLGLRTPNPQIVIGKGRTPNGQRYEVSAYRSPKYGTCFTLWYPQVEQPNRQGTGQCARDRTLPVIGAFCVANSSGCGDSHHVFRDRVWITPAVTIVSPRVARLSVHSTRPNSRIRGIRIVRLSRKFQHEVGAPQAAKLALLFVSHPAGSPVRFRVTAYDEKGRVLGRRADGAGPDIRWQEDHAGGTSR